MKGSLRFVVVSSMRPEPIGRVFPGRTRRRDGGRATHGAVFVTYGEGPREEPPVEGLERLRTPPPVDLEDGVVDALAARGWIARPVARPVSRGSARHGRARSAWRPWAWAAVAAALFLLGALVGGRIGGEGAAPAPGPRYAVLLYEGPDVVAPTTDAERVAVVEAYVAWSDSVRSAGYRLTGEELADPAAGAALPSGSPGARENLVGFHLLSAPDLETASALARTHPHLGRGGRIVVRPIVEHP